MKQAEAPTSQTHMGCIKARQLRALDPWVSPSCHLPSCTDLAAIWSLFAASHGNYYKYGIKRLQYRLKPKSKVSRSPPTQEVASYKPSLSVHRTPVCLYHAWNGWGLFECHALPSVASWSFAGHGASGPTHSTHTCSTKAEHGHTMWDAS